MTLVVTWKRGVKTMLLAVFLAFFVGMGVTVYQLYQWQHEPLGKLENGTPVSRAMLIDALLTKEFTNKEQPKAEPKP